MIDLIKTHIEEPEKLERLYQDDKKLFKSNFLELYSEIENFPQAKFWKARLEYKKTVSKTFNIQKNDIIVLIATCFLTGLLIKLPAIFDFSIKDYSYYEKNSALIVFFGLSLYAVWKNQIFDSKKQFIIFLAFLFPAIYINYLPSDTDSHSINLAYIHLPLLMWCVYGLLYIDFDFK
ncbi:MAG: DUF4153 domain-containing protein, partial [Bacteroidota bacterium]|nr:DUF4153 domain-containing protein [Bacteroidota bacterium]